MNTIIRKAYIVNNGYTNCESCGNKININDGSIKYLNENDIKPNDTVLIIKHAFCCITCLSVFKIKNGY